MQNCNIIYLHTHDCGRYVQPYGYPVCTPNLQRLAEEGVVYRQAHAATPTCSPSRGALLTGSSPHSCELTGLTGMGFGLKDREQHLLFTLKNNGYKTCLIGEQHVAEDPHTIGYDEVKEFPKISRREGGHKNKAAIVAPAAIEWLVKNRSERFFLDIGMDDTHRIWPEPCPEDDPRYVRPPEPISDNPITRKDFASYRTSARLLDKGIGQILDAIDQLSLMENTLVICTTDHGLGFPRMKSSLYDGGTGVMLIIRGPGGFTGGQVSDALVSQIDIFPTVCELLGITPPNWLEGKSLIPLIRGELNEVNEHIFTEINFHGGYDPTRAVRTQKYKYIKHYNNPTFPARTSNQRKGPTLELWIEKGWRERQYPNEELYDLFFDPNESNNLAENPEYTSVLDSMRGRLHRWMQYTKDPLLQGSMPIPKDGIIYDLDSRCIIGKAPLPDCIRLGHEAPSVTYKL